MPINIGVPEICIGNRAVLEKMIIFAAKCIAMEKEEQKKTNFFIKLLEDKKAMRECIQKGGDVDKTAKEHGIKLATPI